MIHIAICDDEPTFVNHFRQLLDRYSAENGEPLKLTAYDDGLALIEQYDPTLDLIFLDIRMPLVDGLTAAEQERLAENDFVRCHTSFLVNLFYVKDVQKLELELLDGEHVPISQPKRKSVMARLADYWGDQL